MREVLLAIVLVALGIYGYFLMKNLDIFLTDNHKSIQTENDKKEKPHIMLTNNKIIDDDVDETNET